jgi:hypothetical protein
MYYILNEDKTVSVCKDVKEWAKVFDNQNRRVASTAKNGVTVSTVFLGLDHQYDDGPPLLFETMVFGGGEDEMMDRYTTWDEAVAGHKRMCDIAFNGESTNET